jgi:hypothetical protein
MVSEMIPDSPMIDGPITVDEGPACIPQPGVDEPDAEWTDSDCDGIDGSAANSIFVRPSSTASDAGNGDGTRANPFHRLTDAISLARTTGRAILAGSGIFHESIEIPEGVFIAGGYHPETWQSGQTATQIIAACPVVRASAVTTSTRVMRIEIVGEDATEPGGS